MGIDERWVIRIHLELALAGLGGFVPSDIMAQGLCILDYGIGCSWRLACAAGVPALPWGVRFPEGLRASENRQVVWSSGLQTLLFTQMSNLGILVFGGVSNLPQDGHRSRCCCRGICSGIGRLLLPSLRLAGAGAELLSSGPTPGSGTAPAAVLPGLPEGPGCGQPWHC